MTEVAQAPAATTTPVKPGVPVKLTTEEMNTRYQFIGKCVDRNIAYPATRVYGQSAPMSVQELCNATVKTLQNIAKAIKKAEEDHDPEFNGTEALRISTIPAQEWLTFFRLTIRKKNWDAYASDKKEHVKELKERINQAKTPDELRREAEAELASIESDFKDED